MSHRAPETWTHRLAAWHVAEIEETVFNPPITDIRASNRQTNMILNVRIVYWIRIRSSQWLTSRIHGHHHILCFLPKAALLGLCCRRIQSLHVWVFLCSVLYLITEMHALLGWNQVTDFAAEKVLISLHRDTRHLFFCCMLWVIIDLHSEVQSHQFCSICLSRVFSPVHFTIHRASPINSHIINKHIFIGSGLCRCYFFFSFLPVSGSCQRTNWDSMY